ncbi:MAG: hypothetical protein LBT05_13650 [Planctomycetaceae bacterium]|nr:hypothetical protein [Planctomycetaceae bacterium]
MTKLFCFSILFVVTIFAAGLFSGCKIFTPATKKDTIAESRNLRQEGILLLERGEIQNAEKKLSEAVELNKKDAEIKRSWAESLWKLGKKQEAVAQLTESLVLTGNNDVKTLLSLSEKCYELGDYEIAFDCAEKAINATKSDWAAAEENRALISRAWVIRARVKRNQNEIQQAFADYHKAISLDPKNAGLLSELAVLQTANHQPERALATWHSVGRLYPPEQEPPQVVFGCGDAYMAMQQYPLACDQYEIANRRWPENINSYCRLAEAKLACGMIHEAAIIAQRAFELAPNHQECLAVRNHVESVIAQQLQGQGLIR